MIKLSIRKDLLEAEPEIKIGCDFCKKYLNAEEVAASTYLGYNKEDMVVVQTTDGAIHNLYSVDLDFEEAA